MGDPDLVPITSKVSHEERDQLDQLAEERGETRSRTIRHIVREHFEPDIESAAVPLVFGIAFLGSWAFLAGDTQDVALSVIGALFIALEASRPFAAMLRDRLG